MVVSGAFKSFIMTGRAILTILVSRVDIKTAIATSEKTIQFVLVVAVSFITQETRGSAALE